MDEPGQDVENFGNKMAKMARQISRTGSDTIGLSTLVANYFIDCKAVSFQMKATGLHILINRKPKVLSADDIIQTLKNKSRSIKAQRMCSLSAVKKSYMEGELVGIELSMKKLAESQKGGGNGQFRYGKAQDLIGITSFRCHKKGQFQYN